MTPDDRTIALETTQSLIDALDAVGGDQWGLALKNVDEARERLIHLENQADAALVRQRLEEIWGGTK